MGDGFWVTAEEWPNWGDFHAYQLDEPLWAGCCSRWPVPSPNSNDPPRVRAGLSVIKAKIERDGKFVSKTGKVRRDWAGREPRPTSKIWHGGNWPKERTSARRQN